jgi:hypothetical protein
MQEMLIYFKNFKNNSRKVSEKCHILFIFCVLFCTMPVQNDNKLFCLNWH